MIDSKQKVRLGELLVDADVVSSADITEAIQVSKRLGIPIGRVLLVSGCVSPLVLEAALEAQPLLNSGEQSLSSVVTALKNVDRSGTSLDRSLDGHGKELKGSVDRFAELLLDSEIVSQDQLDQALATSFESGIPLGSALVLEGILSPSLFPSIVQIHDNIRNGKISKERGVKDIRSTFVHWLKAESSLANREMASEGKDSLLAPYDDFQPAEEEPVDQVKIQPVNTMEGARERTEVGDTPLVEILKEAGVVNQAAIQRAYEEMLDDPRASGEFFHKLGLIDDNVLETALRLYGLAKRGRLSREEVVYAIKKSQSGPLSRQLDRKDKRIKRYFDSSWRKSQTSRVVGVGGLLVATLAGLSLVRKKSK